MKRLARVLLAVAFIGLSLLGGHIAQAAVIGFISLSSYRETTVGTTVTVTVTDADLNVSSTVTDDPATVAANNTDADATLELAKAGYTNGYDFYVTKGTGNFSNGTTSYQVRVSAFPIMDYNSDGVVNFQDVIPSIATVTVFSVSASEGLVTLSSTGAPIGAANIDLNNDASLADAGDGVSFTLSYKAATVNNTGTAVKVYSTSDLTGCSITLDETGPNTGVFTSTFKTAAVTNCAAMPLELAANIGDAVTAAYTDYSPFVQTLATQPLYIDGVPPAFSNLLPVHNTFSSFTTQVLQTDVTDGESGVVSGSIVFALWIDSNGNSSRDAGEPLNTYAPGLIVGISGGYRVNKVVGPLAEGIYYWHVEASDAAGNSGQSDSDSGASGNQDNRFLIDNTPPSMQNRSPAYNTASSASSIVFEADVLDKYPDPTAITLSYWLDANGNSFQDAGENSTTVSPDETTEILNGHHVQKTLSGLSNGVYFWRFNFRDKAGNMGVPSDYKLTIDAPPVPTPTPTPTLVPTLTPTPASTPVPGAVPGVSGPGLVVMAGLLLAVAVVMTWRLRSQASSSGI
ncbi:MAG: hypothetical protein Q8O40_04220 [Chloroflexota bacterium]|nr:hypothetical protein [Chloroflexota bacterium]